MTKDSLVKVRDIEESIEDFSSIDKSNINFWLSQLERYSPKKVISICLCVGADRETAEEVAREIDKYADNRIRMSEIRPLIFSFLRERDPSAARRFRAGEIYVRTSAQVFERFNREKIVSSLLKESGIEESTAEEIATEVEKFIRNSNLDYVSSSLIRELVNAKLIEHGLEDIRRTYTRVGLPVFDITNLIKEGTKENANLQYNPETIHKLMGDQMIREYTLTKILPRELTHAHLNGQIHIHDLDYFPLRPFCFSHDIRFFLKNGFKPDGTGDHATVAGPARTPEVAFLHAAKILASAQTNCSGGQGFSYFNTFLAPVVRGLSYKQIKQLAQMFVFEMGQMYVARGGQTVFSSIDMDMTIPKMFRDVRAVELGGKVGSNTYGDYEEEARTLFNAFLDIYMNGDYQGKPFNFPKFEVQIYPSDLKNGKFDEELIKVSELAAKFGTPYYIINQPYMPEFACYQSMPYDEKILIIKDNRLELVKIGKYVEDMMESGKEKGFGLEGEVEVSDCRDYALSFDPRTLRIEKKRIRKVMRHKTKEKILKLTLDGNRTISATQKHKIPVVRNNRIIEVRFENIKKGDYVIGLKKIDIDFSPMRTVKFKDKEITVDKDFARLLGYFSSEGYIHVGNKKNRANKVCFSFNSKEKDLIEDVMNILKKKFYLNPKLDVSKKNKTTTVYVYDKNFVNLFVEDLKTGKDAKSKRVPWVILSSSTDIVKEFLLGLFKGDGYFSEKKIDLHLCNKDLIDDVFVLSLRIGIPFEFLSYTGKRDSYSLRLTSSKRMNNFLSSVPFAKTDGGLPEKTFDFYERIPTIPFEITRDNMKIGHWNRSQIGKRVTAKRLEMKGSLFSRFYHSDLHIFEVKKIEEVKSEYVYDLVDVEDYHNFANVHGIFSSNCCAYLMPLDKSINTDNLEEEVIRGGSLQVVTINLPQIAYEAKGDDKKLFELLEERMKKAKMVMLLRRDIVEKNLKNGLLPFLSQKVNENERYFETDKQSYTIGLVGINEMVKFHTGEELHESRSAWMFGLKVMKYMKEVVARFRKETGLNFALARTPAESTASRLARIDRKIYRAKAIVQGDATTDSIYYTNSFHVRPSADIDLFERMKIEGAFHPLTDGGAMSHIWLGETHPNSEAIMNLTKKIAVKTAIQYMAYTKDLTICESCGFVTGGLHEKCPKCKSSHVQNWSRITGYYQNIKGWDKGKIAELHDRKRYGVV